MTAITQSEPVENPTDFHLWTLREALEQSRAALPDRAFSKNYSIDPNLIDDINSALTDDADDNKLLALLTEARTFLPMAWEKQGGCDSKLLKAVDWVLHSFKTELHSAHIESYSEYLEAVDWEKCCETMRRAEGIWEDNGCAWPCAFDLSDDEDTHPRMI